MDRFRRLISTATAIALSVTSFRPVSAQGLGMVYCTNCGTEWTALASKVVLVEQLINQGKQLENEVSQLANMVTNTKAIPNMLWGTATAGLQSAKQSSQPKQVSGIHRRQP